MIAITIISLACSALALVIFFRYGREYRPKFTEKYWRDVPARDIHPAVVTRIWNWNKPDKDIPVTLLHLSEIGVIRLVRLPEHTPKKQSDFAIIKATDFKGTLTKIDERFLKFLFGALPKEVGQNAGARSIQRDNIERIKKEHQTNDVVLLSDFERYKKQSPERFSHNTQGVQREIDKQVKNLKAFEDDGPSFGVLLGMIVAGLLFGIFIVNGKFPDLAIWSFELLAVIILCIVLGIFMTRRSPRANEIAAKSAALKRWLEDFSLLNERPITDVKLWGQLMVYAAGFGVAGKALSQLRHVVPNVANDAVFIDGVGIWFDVVDVAGRVIFEGAIHVAGGVMESALEGLGDGVGDILSGAVEAVGEVIGGIGDGL